MAKFDFFTTPDPEKKGRKKFIAKVVGSGDMDIEEIARLAAHYTRANRGVILMAWDTILERILEALKEGKRVHLDGLGYLTITATSHLVDKPNEIRAESVHYKGVHFRADKSCNRSLRTTRFERMHARHSVKTDNNKVVDFLKTHFQTNEYITRKELVHTCTLSPTSANRILKQLVEEDFLKHPGARNSAFYFQGDKLKAEQASLL